MPDIQDWYLGQVVTEGEMDTIYTDMTAAERNMAKEANLGQGPVASAPRSGGILKGLVVTKLTADSVQVTLGAARDSEGRRIALPSDASVSLLNLGSTPEGTLVNATGDGSLTASSITAGEAWLSLFLAFDTNLSDSRVDSLNNIIYFRQTESFHFELLIGSDSAPPATSRANLADDRVLLTDILLDNNGEIRVISALDAICSSSLDLAKIGYGLDDAAALDGRRSDWVSLDPDGTDLELWHNAVLTGNPNNKAYFAIREGDPREMMFAFAQAYSEPGDATKVAGSELIGGKETTGSALSSPGAAAALDLAADSSIHAQLVQLRDKVNTLLSRGSDTLTGSLTITNGLTLSGGNLVIGGTGTLTVPGLTTLANVLVEKELTVRPAATFDGLNLDAANMDPLTFIARLGLRKDAGNTPILDIDAYGGIMSANIFYENWMALPDVTGGVAADRWEKREQNPGLYNVYQAPHILPGVAAAAQQGGGYQYIEASNVASSVEGIATKTQWHIRNFPVAVVTFHLDPVGPDWNVAFARIGFENEDYPTSAGKLYLELDGAGNQIRIFAQSDNTTLYNSTTNLRGTAIDFSTPPAKPTPLTFAIGAIASNKIFGAVLTPGGVAEVYTLPAGNLLAESGTPTQLRSWKFFFDNVNEDATQHRWNIQRVWVTDGASVK